MGLEGHVCKDMTTPDRSAFTVRMCVPHYSAISSLYTLFIAYSTH